MSNRLCVIAMVTVMGISCGVMAQENAGTSESKLKTRVQNLGNVDAIEVACTVLGIDLNDGSDQQKSSSGTIRRIQVRPVINKVEHKSDDHSAHSGDEVNAAGKQVIVIDDSGKKWVVAGESSFGDHGVSVDGSGAVQVLRLQQEEESKQNDEKNSTRTIVIGKGKDGKTVELSKEVIEALKAHGIELKVQRKTKGDNSEGSPSDQRMELQEKELHQKIHGELKTKLHKEIVGEIHGALQKHKGKLSDETKKRIHEEIAKSVQLHEGIGEKNDGKIRIEVIIEDGEGKHHKSNEVFEFRLKEGHRLQQIPHAQGHQVRLKADEKSAQKQERTPQAHRVVVKGQQGETKVISPTVAPQSVAGHNVYQPQVPAPMAGRVIVPGAQAGNSSADLKALEKRLISLEKKLDTLLKALNRDRD